MKSATPDQQQMVVLGRVNGAHGVKGWNKLESFTAEPDDIGKFKTWFIRGGKNDRWREVEWEEIRWQGKRLVMRMKGSTDRNGAEGLVGSEIAVRRSELPELGEDEFYWHQLIGLKVQCSRTNAVFGTISDMLETGANDVLVVTGKGCEGAMDDRERLIPYLPEQVITEVNVNAGIVLVDWDAEF